LTSYVARGYSGIRKHSQRDRAREFSAVAPQKLFDLVACVRHAAKAYIHLIDQQNNFHRRVSLRGIALRGNGLERQDLLWLFVVEEREVLLLQARDRLSGFIGHHYIQSDVAIRAGRRSRLLRKSTNSQKAEETS
jgi:hypothetical protein